MAGPVDVKCTFDDREFQRAFNELLKLPTSKAPEEIAIKKCWFIARNAVNQTDAATKEEIEADLLKPSAVNPNAPIAAILVNSKRAATGKTKTSRKGLSGPRMQAAMQKLIRARQATRNFVKSGAVAMARALAPFVKKKGGAPKMESVKIKGRPKGGASVQRGLWKASVEIFNDVRGGKVLSPIVEKVALEGLEKGAAMELKDMKEYIEKKHLEEITKKFNKA